MARRKIALVIEPRVPAMHWWNELHRDDGCNFKDLSKIEAQALIKPFALHYLTHLAEELRKFVPSTKGEPEMRNKATMRIASAA